jgi:hypothetical protein
MRTDFERTSALGHCDAIAAIMYGLRTQDKSNPYHDPELQRQMSNQVSWSRGDSGMVSISKSISPMSGRYQKKTFGGF